MSCRFLGSKVYFCCCLDAWDASWLNGWTMLVSQVHAATAVCAYWSSRTSIKPMLIVCCVYMSMQSCNRFRVHVLIGSKHWPANKTLHLYLVPTSSISVTLQCKHTEQLQPDMCHTLYCHKPLLLLLLRCCMCHLFAGTFLPAWWTLTYLRHGSVLQEAYGMQRLCQLKVAPAQNHSTMHIAVLNLAWGKRELWCNEGVIASKDTSQKQRPYKGERFQPYACWSASFSLLGQPGIM